MEFVVIAHFLDGDTMEYSAPSEEFKSLVKFIEGFLRERTTHLETFVRYADGSVGQSVISF